MTARTPTGNIYDKYSSRNPIERRLVAGFFDALERSLPDEPPTSVLAVRTPFPWTMVSARIR